MRLDVSAWLLSRVPVLRRARVRIITLSAATLVVSAVACSDILEPPRQAPTPAALTTAPLEAEAADVEEEPMGEDVPGGLQGEVGVTGERGYARMVLGRINHRLLARITVWQSAWEIRGTHSSFAAPAGFLLSFGCNLKAWFAVFDDRGFVAMNRDFRPPDCWAADALANPAENYLVLFPGTAEGGRGQSFVANHCNPGCYGYGGSTTIKVTPVAQQLRVSASRPRVPVGEEVTFTAYRADGRPLTAVESWVWKPKDKSKPAQTIACEGTAPTCTAKIYEDGRMWATANLPFADWWYGTMWETAGAKVAVEERFELRSDKTEDYIGEVVTFTPYLNDQRVTAARWRWVPDGAQDEPPVLSAATSGMTPSLSVAAAADPLDPPQPREVPECAGKDECGWTLDGPGTMWAYRSSETSGGAEQGASRQVAVKPDKFSVLCVPNNGLRGVGVMCSATLEPPVAFRVTQATVKLLDGSESLLRPHPPGDVAASDSYTLAGDRVVPSLVEMSIQAERGGVPRQFKAAGTFDVTPRPWTLPREPAYEATTNIPTNMPDLYRVMTRSPHYVGEDDVAFGVTRLANLSRKAIQTKYVDEGPNRDIAYVAQEPPLKQAITHLNPHLFAGAWYDDQNGGTDPETGRPRCQKADIPLLIAEILRHEGIGRHPYSHMGIEDSHRPTIAKELERAFSVGTDRGATETRLRFFVEAMWYDMTARLIDPLQAAFDAADTPKIIFGTPAHCLWDYEENDG